MRQIGGKHAGGFSEITCITRKPVCLRRQCKQFVEGGDDTIKMVLTWMDGWYKGDSDEAIIDTDVFVENAKKFGTYCGKNPTMSIVKPRKRFSASEVWRSRRAG